MEIDRFVGEIRCVAELPLQVSLYEGFLFREGSLIFPTNEPPHITYFSKVRPLVDGQYEREKQAVSGKNKASKLAEIEKRWEHQVDRHVALAYWAENWEGCVPHDWLESQNIIQAVKEAKVQGVQLSELLIDAGVWHPFAEVRTAFWENQILTEPQMRLAACMGVNLSDPKERGKADALVASFPPDRLKTLRSLAA